MKVVINKCFGGFGISIDALKELVKRGSDCIETYTPKHYYGGENEKNRKKNEWEERWKNDFATYIELGDGLMAHPSAFNIFKDGLLYSLKDRGDNEVRSNKDLIEVVELLGSKSFGFCAELKVIEVPDGIDWQIDEYDGSEEVEEVHKTWS